jgi:hypothetical protein
LVWRRPCDRVRRDGGRMTAATSRKVTAPIASVPIGLATVNGQTVEVRQHPEFVRFFFDLFTRVGGATGGGWLTAEEVDDRVAGLLVAGSNIGLIYDDANDELEISALNVPDAIRVDVDFGVGWNDKAQTVLVNQAWVTENSAITAQVLTPPGSDPDEMYLLDMRAEVSDLVPGVGFTVTAYSQPEATGEYTVMVIGG